MENSIRVLAGLPKLALVFLLIVLLSTCSKGTLLIVSDPYAELLDDYSLQSRYFLFRLRISGYTIISRISDRNTSVSQILEELQSIPDYIILSAVNANAAQLPALSESLSIIIAEAIPPEGSAENVVTVAADTSKAYRKVGGLAARIVAEKEKPALLLHSGGIEEIVAGFSESESPENLIAIDIGNLRYADSIPGEFSEKSKEASVILLFAGTHNTKGFNITAESAHPVITENAMSLGRRNERILGSVEYAGPRMRRAILSVLREKSENSVVYYPVRLEK